MNTLKRSSRLFKWAYLPDTEEDIPLKTTLCALIARSLVATPLFCLFLFLVSIFAVPILLLMLLWTKTGGRWWKDSLLRAAVLDFKNRTCTVIEIEQEVEKP